MESGQDTHLPLVLLLVLVPSPLDVLFGELLLLSAEGVLVTPRPLS